MTLPQQPPRDQNGEVIPHDHPEILADHQVIRRISREHIVSAADGSPQVSTIAFNASTTGNKGMSIDIEPFIVAKGADPRDFVTTPIWVGSVIFSVNALRGEHLQVGYDPIPANDCHGEVWTVTTKGQKKKLRALAQWFVPLDGVKLA